jgi:hypothetical protein
MMRPPPMPWITRNTIKLISDQEKPQSSDPIRKVAIAAIHMLRAPKRCADQPASGMTIASASR